MTPLEMQLLRKQYKLTQAEFGARLVPPVTRLTVCNWERARFAIPVDIEVRLKAADLMTPAAKTPKASASLIKATVEAYRLMREQPGHVGTHAFALDYWHKRGFTPCREAMEQIAAEFPDILNPGETK
jgi:transcriptional regulator with XRE-family HTH domain